MFPAADDAEKILVLRQVPGQITLGKLLSHFDLIETLHQGVSKIPDEFTVLACVGVLDQFIPPEIGYRQDLLVGVIDDVQLTFSTLSSVLFG